MGILWAVALAIVALVAGNPATWYEGPHPEAVQTSYRAGVPHTDRQGKLLQSYDPGRSFFPIGIYHGLDGSFRGRQFDMRVVRDAGFNTVHVWEGLPIDAAVVAAERNGLQLVFHNPTEPEIEKWKSHHTLLAWYLNEEPSLKEWDPGWLRQFEAFRERLGQIHKQDPGRAVFALDGPFIDPPRRERWLQWNSAGDVSAHWNYPIRTGAVGSFSGRRGIPESVTTAVRLNKEQKPVWLVIQAFSSEQFDWRMPSPAELRAMVYGGLVHGATGIFYFALDSFVTRDGQVLGVAPWTEESYGPSPDHNNDGLYPRVVTLQQVAESKALWEAIGNLNREISSFVPELLSPTSRLPYSVHASLDGMPVRTMLKQRGDELTLFVVNVDPVPVDFQIVFEDGLAGPALLAGRPGRMQMNGRTLNDRLDGFGANVYRFRLPSR